MLYQSKFLRLGIGDIDPGLRQNVQLARYASKYDSEYELLRIGGRESLSRMDVDRPSTVIFDREIPVKIASI